MPVASLAVSVRVAVPLRGGWILITWCLARSLAAAFGLAFMRFAGTGCDGPAGVT